MAVRSVGKPLLQFYDTKHSPNHPPNHARMVAKQSPNHVCSDGGSISLKSTSDNPSRNMHTPNIHP
jgi:hypothetical protein